MGAYYLLCGSFLQIVIKLVYLRSVLDGGAAGLVCKVFRSEKRLLAVFIVAVFSSSS